MFLFEKIINTHNNELKKINFIVENILKYHSKVKKLTNDNLKMQTLKFKNKLNNGYSLDDILPEVFATIKEVIFRLLNIDLYNVQLIGGIVLHQGRIAEMKTGEGKTLVATLPAYLNALLNHSVHIVTVNDYLAKRDSEWMKPIYEFLGLKVGVILSNITLEEKKIAYSNNVIYGTNNEFAFDYLRDNMVTSDNNIIQRKKGFVIIDEVDSILIDEARTPLVISSENKNYNNIYFHANSFAKKLSGIKIKEYSTKESYNDLLCDFLIDEKNKNITLTNHGLSYIEKEFNIKEYNNNSLYIIHIITQSLKAIFLMKKDVDYIIENEKIIIVDEFTGRLMLDRRYSNGLHQAIEAKENVKIKSESKTLATITFQNYFKTYLKISGMTGTALTEEKEFQEIYNLDVISIPTNKPIIRKDMPDVIYKTEKSKIKAIVNKIIECNKKGQPVLVGTVSIEKSEIISKELFKYKIKHFVLNAKSHHDEAKIISQAGKLYAVTIATNMAGRGTDIVLGGNINFIYKNKYEKMPLNNDIEKVKSVGGLMIIGTERHENRRIDYQLRGRSGRQGDPGCSIFYLSLEDELMRLFGSEKIIKIMTALGANEDIPLQAKILSNSIEKAQRKIENQHFTIRKNLLQYDSIINLQRNLIYSQRLKILKNNFNLLNEIKYMLEKVIKNFMSKNYNFKEKMISETNFNFLMNKIYFEYKFDSKNEIFFKKNESKIKLQKRLNKYFLDLIICNNINENFKVILLKIVDKHWIYYINTINELRYGIELRCYSHYDPILEYKKESFNIYNKIIFNIQNEFIKYILNKK